MPDPTRISVCIVAFTYDEFIEAEPKLSADVRASIDEKTWLEFRSKGVIYGDSREAWCPFENRKRVSEYFTEAGYAPGYVSSDIDLVSTDSEKLADIAGEVDLYVFDPLLVASGSYPDLITGLNVSIRTNKKHFCVVLPSRLGLIAQSSLETACEGKLTLLKAAPLKNGIGQWKTDDEARLIEYLARRDVKGEPAALPDQLQRMFAILAMNSPAAIAPENRPVLVGSGD